MTDREFKTWASKRVAADLAGLFEGIAKGNFPFDYFEVKELAEKAGN